VPRVGEGADGMRTALAYLRFPLDCIRLRSVSRAVWVLDYRLHEV
jgi:hypothetical protein